MLAKILIANRGEIACRVMATARRLGMRTVAVYSDADAGARHVAMADEAVRIGGPAAADSYLRGERVIEAALATGAEAIHPGYGFLSENPGFAEVVAAAGLVFVGPPASAIRAMGLKDAAKALMEASGVPVVPGYHGADQDPGLLAEEARRIGWPVLIKARAGGGGKGMRKVDRAGDFAAALEGAQREGQASFGDPAVLIERYVTRPRHIEMQVFADAHGNVLHLFERDCSLQRRHQKVIEEAPAPGMPAGMREAMGRAAVQAARAVGYVGAGTVEFIADGSGPLRPDGFWFMEMNTRLQVEHPVTEAITGLDLVEWQLRIAAGEPLPLRQQELSIDGWAFEARLCAEDVPSGFLPATGRLDRLRFPPAAEFERGPVRVDSGVREGDAIGPWYDPMIAKLVVHGATRAAALNRLAAALADTQVLGAVTNLAFLGALAGHEGFRRGEVDTGLIARDFDSLTAEPPPSPEVVALAALGGLGLTASPVGSDPWDVLAGWRHWTDARLYIGLDGPGGRIDAEVTQLGRGSYTVAAGGATTTLALAPLAGTEVRVVLGNRQFTADVVRDGPRIAVFADGGCHSFALPDALAGAAAVEHGGDSVIAPMPGLVRQVRVQAGARVTRGEALMVLEAMKMEHTLTAPRDGAVAEVLAQAGDQVTAGTLLVRLRDE